MDKIERYKKVIRATLSEHLRHDPVDSAVETRPIFDDENGRYQLIRHGWRGESRVFGIIIHIEIRNGKVWIERDGIETGIARELMAHGIPKSDIVLGFRSPYMRQFMDFAVA